MPDNLTDTLLEVTSSAACQVAAQLSQSPTVWTRLFSHVSPQSLGAYQRTAHYVATQQFPLKSYSRSVWSAIIHHLEKIIDPWDLTTVLEQVLLEQSATEDFSGVHEVAATVSMEDSTLSTPDRVSAALILRDEFRPYWDQAFATLPLPQQQLWYHSVQNLLDPTEPMDFALWTQIKIQLCTYWHWKDFSPGTIRRFLDTALEAPEHPRAIEDMAHDPTVTAFLSQLHDEPLPTEADADSTPNTVPASPENPPSGDSVASSTQTTIAIITALEALTHDSPLSAYYHALTHFHAAFPQLATASAMQEWLHYWTFNPGVLGRFDQIIPLLFLL